MFDNSLAAEVERGVEVQKLLIDHGLAETLSRFVSDEEQRTTVMTFIAFHARDHLELMQPFARFKCRSDPTTDQERWRTDDDLPRFFRSLFRLSRRSRAATKAVCREYKDAIDEYSAAYAKSEEAFEEAGERHDLTPFWCRVAVTEIAMTALRGYKTVVNLACAYGPNDYRGVWSECDRIIAVMDEALLDDLSDRATQGLSRAADSLTIPEKRVVEWVDLFIGNGARQDAGDGFNNAINRILPRIKVRLKNSVLSRGTPHAAPDLEPAGNPANGTSNPPSKTQIAIEARINFGLNEVDNAILRTMQSLRIFDPRTARKRRAIAEEAGVQHADWDKSFRYLASLKLTKSATKAGVHLTTAGQTHAIHEPQQIA